MLYEVITKTLIFCYGTSGSGKSVWIMQLANFFSSRFRAKALYCSHEEAFKKSMRDRSNNFNIESKKLYVGMNIDFETLLHKIQRIV